MLNTFYVNTVIDLKNSLFNTNSQTYKTDTDNISNLNLVSLNRLRAFIHQMLNYII